MLRDVKQEMAWRHNLSLAANSRGEDVRRAQELLSAAGFDPGPFDGIFGIRTDKAVRDFQTSRRLDVDGIIGPITWAALTTPAAPGGAPHGRSLHIGINVVDNAAYGQIVPDLRGCENDARDMQALAQTQGFSSEILLSPQATAANVADAISRAAGELQAGDFFFISYSGHGSQMRDLTGDELSGLDQTWVLYDRQLLDDELYALWGGFQPGVRIVVLSDSCHSGTVTRDAIFAYQAFSAAFQDTREVGFVLNTPMPMVATRDISGMTELREAVRGVMPSVVGQLYGGTRTATLPEVDRHVDLVLGLLQGDTPGVVLEQSPRTRNLPAEISDRDAAARQGLYRQAKLATRAASPPQASVLLISGCQDNQLSLDGTRNGLFTQRLLEVWNRGSFAGTYAEMHRQIVAQMPPQQTPNLYWATPEDPVFAQQQPFSIS